MVQVRQVVAQVRLCAGNALAPEVGELRDLVREHGVDGRGGEELGFGARAGAVVEEDGEDAYIGGGRGKGRVLVMRHLGSD